MQLAACSSCWLIELACYIKIQLFDLPNRCMACIVYLHILLSTQCLCSLQDLPTGQKCDNEPGGLDPDGSESDEDLPREIKKTPNAVQVLPPLELKDQIQLLTSGSSSWSTNQNAGDDNDLDESVSQSMLDGKKTLRTCSSEKSRNASASSDGSGEKMKIPSSQPPWIEMVSVCCAWL